MMRQPRGGGFAFHAPIKAGDQVDLIFYSRPLGQSHTDGEGSDHAPGRMNDISDAVAFPGGSGDTNRMSGLPNDRMHFGTENGQAGMQIKPDGTLDIVKGGDSVLAIMKDFVTLFMNHHNLGAPLDEAAEASAILTRINQMKAT